MRKILALVVIVMVTSFPMAAAESPLPLKKYLEPADITKLDWLLLKAQVSSFSKDIRWDDYGLIDSVSLFAINQRGKLQGYKKKSI